MTIKRSAIAAAAAMAVFISVGAFGATRGEAIAAMKAAKVTGEPGIIIPPSAATGVRILRVG